jgi:hypothetical protein
VYTLLAAEQIIPFIVNSGAGGGYVGDDDDSGILFLV